MQPEVPVCYWLARETRFPRVRQRGNAMAVSQNVSRAAWTRIAYTGAVCREVPRLTAAIWKAAATVPRLTIIVDFGM